MTILCVCVCLYVCRDNYFAAALWAFSPISFKNDGHILNSYGQLRRKKIYETLLTVVFHEKLKPISHVIFTLWDTRVVDDMEKIQRIWNLLTALKLMCVCVCVCVCVSVCLSACLPACLPACLSVCLSACLPACLPACLFVHVSLCCSVCLCLQFVGINSVMSIFRKFLEIRKFKNSAENFRKFTKNVKKISFNSLEYIFVYSSRYSIPLQSCALACIAD